MSKNEHISPDGQVSIHFSNLAGQYGVAKAKEMLGITDEPETPVAPAVTPEKTAKPVTDENAEAVKDAKAADKVAVKRAKDDEMAKSAKAADLKAMLDAAGVKYATNASKGDLLKAYLARA